MYESPIKLFFDAIENAVADIAKKYDAMVFDAVAKVGVTVDKDELLRALHYDRDQYDKGFADGKAAAMDELVRCKDCKHRPTMSGVDWGQGLEFPEDSKCPCKCEDPWYDWMPEDDWFCPYGERRSE